jgi:hypothetical protein
VATLTAQAAVRIAFGLSGLVKTLTSLQVGFGVVFFPEGDLWVDPGQDMLGIQGDAVAEPNVEFGQFSLQQSHAAVE